MRRTLSGLDSCYTSSHSQYECKDAEQFIARQILNDWTTNPTWGIEFEGHLLGGINLRIEHEHRRASLGYGLARAHRGQGLTTEAAQAVIDAAFHTLPDLNRIEASADARNAASLRVMEKVGMQREAVLRQHRLHHGVFIDEARCGILRPEWQQLATSR